MNNRSNNLNMSKKAITFGMILLVIIGTIMATDIRATGTGNIEWDVTLNFSDCSGNDSYVVFGEKSDALDNKDSYDVPKPPASQPPYIYAWFDANLSEPYDVLWEDYRQYPGDFKTWDLYVKLSFDSDVTISWDTDEVSGSEYVYVWLYDDSDNFLVDMKTTGQYTISESETTYHFQIIASEPNNGNGDNGSNGNGGNGNGGNGDGTTNLPPVADANGPYTGFVGVPVVFDGSGSSDPDGDITNYTWHFGDGTEGYGEITDHTYIEVGNYTVTLSVIDNGGIKCSNLTYAIINVANNPPSTPVIAGSRMGQKNIIYNYTAVSTDLDNDTVRYFFDWDDDTNNTVSDFLASGIIYNTSHNWTTSGVYTVRVYAEDENNGVSGTTEMTVFIDVNVLFIDDVIQGYLLDIDNDGIYDIFHNNATGNETSVELQDNGNYLINSDGDTIWNYEYNPWTSMLIQYSGEGEYSEEETDGTLWYLMIGIVVILLVIIMVYGAGKLKENQKLKKKK